MLFLPLPPTCTGVSVDWLSVTGQSALSGHFLSSRFTPKNDVKKGGKREDGSFKRGKPSGREFFVLLSAQPGHREAKQSHVRCGALDGFPGKKTQDNPCVSTIGDIREGFSLQDERGEVKKKKGGSHYATSPSQKTVEGETLKG